MPTRRASVRVRAAAVPEAAVPDQHAALRHLGRDGVVRRAVVGGVVGEVRAGDDPRRAVLLGEVGERPHRVADGRHVRLVERDELVVGVDRLRGLARDDRDRRQRRHEAARVEDALDDGQHARVHRDRLVQRAEREQVVDPDGARSLERVVGRDDLVGAARAAAGRRRARRRASGSMASSTIV